MPGIAPLLALLVAAQPSPGWLLEHWSVADGLPVNGITDLAQTPDGYIWGSTYDGLVRFDGVRFTTFTPEDPGTSHRFTTVTAAVDGTLWLSTELHQLLNFVDGRFLQPSDPFTTNGAAKPRIYSVSPVGPAVLFGLVGGVARARGGVLEVLVATPSSVRALAESPGGAVILSTTDHGVFIFEDDTLRPVPGPRDVNLLVAVGDTGFAAGVDRHIYRIEGARVVDDVLFPGSIGALGERDGTLYVGTSSGTYELRGHKKHALDRGSITGLHRTPVHSHRGQPIVRTARTLRVAGEVRFRSSYVSAHLVGRDGGLWEAVYASGLYRLSEHPQQMLGSKPYSAYAVHETRAGDILVATLGQGLLQFRKGKLVESWGDEQGVDGDIAWTTLEDAEGTVWVAGAGICRIRGADCEVADPDSLFANKHIRSLFVDSAQRLWAGADDGLYLRVGETWTRENDRLALPDAEVRVMYQTASGTMWLGTVGAGLVRIDKVGTRIYDEKDGLQSTLIRGIHEDERGHLWLASENSGLIHFDPETTTFTRIGKREGLFDDTIHVVLDDGQGRFWINSNRGIFWIRRSELDAFVEGRATRVRSVPYTEKQGLDNREGNGGVQSAGIRTRDGHLYFPTQSRVAIYDPRDLGEDTKPPLVVIENVVSDGQRSLTVTYSALSFSRPDKIAFRYRLLGFDDEWVDAGSRRRAFYTNIGPGTYRFEVQATTEDHVRSMHSAHYEWVVRPLFYETRVFLLGLLAAFLALAYLGFRWRLARAVKREVDLAAIVAARTSELEAEKKIVQEQANALQALDLAKSHFFAHINHELRTPLTLITGSVQQMLDKGVPQDMLRSLEVMARNGERLERLINRILELERIESGEQQVHLTSVDVRTLVHRVVESFVGTPGGRRIAVEAAPETFALADEELLETVLINLLSNAIKYGGDTEEIRVSTRVEGNQVRISVKDGGPGIDDDALPRIFDRFYRGQTQDIVGSGLGLTLVRTLTEAQSGEVVASNNTDGGMTFVVSLAAADRAPAYQLEEQDILKDSCRTDHGLTVLIVEDNVDLRAFVKSILQDTYNIRTAPDGRAALHILREATIDLVVSDVMMPDLNGFEMAREINADPATTNIPILFLTARASAEDELTALDTGAMDYLSKPFVPKVLKKRVDLLVNKLARLRDLVAKDVPVPELPSAPNFADEVRALVAANIAEEALDVQWLVAKLAMSRAQLFRKLAEDEEITPRALIRGVRLDRAQSLLQQGAGNVSEIAFAVGFSSASQFSRAFRTHFGHTPSAVLRGKAS